MATAIKQGLDLHTESAKAALRLDRDPTDEERQVGKVLNFSIVYGGGRPTVMRQLGLDWKEAGSVLMNFHRRWPGIALVNHRISETIDHRGYVKTVFGRHLHPESLHKATNAVIQGSAAELMKFSLINVHSYLKAEDYVSHLVLTIHDELVIDAKTSEISNIATYTPLQMNYGRVSEVVPIEVDVEWSTQTWADKRPFNFEEAHTV